MTSRSKNKRWIYAETSNSILAASEANCASFFCALRMFFNQHLTMTGIRTFADLSHRTFEAEIRTLPGYLLSHGHRGYLDVPPCVASAL